MSKYVLDASAILALMFSEPGKNRVEEVLDEAIVSRINITEVLTKLLERGSSIAEAHKSILDLKLSIAEFNETQSKTNAELRIATKHIGLSFGDRACLALAIQENATAVTADRIWVKLDFCPIEIIR